jgi:transposase-like protein
MIDWTWITKKICLIIYYDYINKKVIHFWFYDAERYEYIENDLKTLRDDYKYKIEYFVVDWAKNIKKAIEKVFPNAKIQRCLTHIKRWGELQSKR